MTLDDLLRAGALGALDVHFARAMARLGGEDDARAVLGAALASRRARLGHVCADLADLAGELASEGDEEVEEGDGDQLRWPALEAWTEALKASPLVSHPPPDPVPTPLVLDRADRLYLTRHWLHQAHLARRLLELADARPPALDEAVLGDGLQRLFPEGEGGQRRAAEIAVRRRFAVISGGPGTGKTATVVRILALLIEQAAARGGAVPAIRLVAPTGKAAARLAESIREARTSRERPLNAAQYVLDAIGDEASTIHRALGWTPAGAFRHDAEHPLAADVLVVDEASMVDLVLMSRLVQALPQDARLILLGDKDQLASVEAGAVLGDICATALDRPGTPLHHSVIHLTRSYRFGPDSGIGRLARAIHEVDPAEVLTLLTRSPDLQLLQPSAADLGRTLEPLIDEGFGPYLGPGGPDARLEALGRFRILCAHRRGPFGVEALNPLAESILARRRGLAPRGPLYRGRPVLITANDYQQRLFNGDVGLIDRDDDGDLRAFFPDADDGLRAIAPSRLPPHETVFATTIHKSQGSEFDHVLVVLPSSPSPVVTRELLYTAVTRARQRVTVVGTDEVIEHAVKTPVKRASGLGDLLVG
jgi:exodeoxyribonuclease V alpha subunit